MDKSTVNANRHLLHSLSQGKVKWNRITLSITLSNKYFSFKKNPQTLKSVYQAPVIDSAREKLKEEGMNQWPN